MVNATHTSYQAGDRSYYSILKKDIHHKAAEAGYSTQRLGELDLILAEMTSNLHKYANDGEILMGILKDEHGLYLELICIDNGPGMTDTAKMMADGYSSSSTLGQGLGSIKRLSDHFDLYSVKGWGTIVLSRIYKTPPTESAKRDIEVKPLVVAKKGEEISGDGFYYKASLTHLKVLMADGLGHGPLANQAVNAAVDSFKRCQSTSPVDILRFMHFDIRKTRGMVASVATFNFATKQLHIAGIGNIAVKLLNTGGETKNQISYNGIVGHNIPNTMSDQVINYTDYQMLIFCSDGIKTRWDLSKYTGINKCDLTIMAAAIYKDFSRGTDDTSVVILKLK